jgi:hypothetical protein
VVFFLKINVMKFESINSSKFEKFKTNTIQDSFKLLGGVEMPCTYKSNDGTSGKDAFDADTQGKSGWTSNGHAIDYHRIP